MSTTRINELPAAAGVASNDFLAIDNTSGVSQKITAAQLVNVDNTLSVAGRPADAKATGDAISEEAAARESVGTEVDELKSAIVHDGNWKTVTWVDGKYVSRQGGLASNNRFSYAEISLKNMNKIRFLLNSTNANVSYCTKTSAGVTVAYGFVHTPTSEWVEHTVTDTEVTIRISSDIDLKSEFLFFYLSDWDSDSFKTIEGQVDGLASDIGKLEDEAYTDIQASEVVWSAGKYDPSTGLEYGSAATFRITINGTTANYATECLRSKPIPSNIIFIRAKGQNDYFYVSAWDENNDYVGIYDEATNTFIKNYSNDRITSVQRHLRIDAVIAAHPEYSWCVVVGDITNASTDLDPDNVNNYIYFSVSSIGYLKDKLTITKDGGFCRIFKKFGCIGDSLASGAFEYKDGSTDKIDFIYEFSWGQYLARMCANSAINFSTGGLTTRTWLASEYCTQMMSGGDNLCDCYIVALGVNDLKTDDRNVPVGVIGDIDLTDYTQNEDTYYGNMGGIIQRIKSVQPRAKIFLVTNPGRTQAERAAAVPYNSALTNICGIFTDVYLADLYALGLFDQRLMLASHYGSNGYLKAAWEISSLISAIIEDNPAAFREVAFIGTNKTWGA